MILTDAEIRECNKLIAKFMGYKYRTNYTLNGAKGVYVKSEKLSMLITDFTYHSSWNSIMEVVELVESMGYKIDLMGSYYFGRRYRVYISGIGSGDYSNETILEETHVEIKDQRLMCLYTAVVEFIKWYNLIK